MYVSKQASSNGPYAGGNGKKYNKKFEVVDFIAAKDSTYHNILKLSSDGIVFKVYQRGGEQYIWDNYISMLVNNRVKEFVVRNIIGELPSGMEIFTSFSYHGYNDYTYDDAVSFDVQDFIHTKYLSKAICVVRTTEPFEVYEDAIFKTYEAICSLDSRLLEFEMIEVNESDSMLNNELAYLGDSDGNWGKYKSVIQSTAVSDQTITSPKDLIKR